MFLGGFLKKIKGIKKFHHFTFTASQPGLVTVKTSSDNSESTIDLRQKGCHLPSRSDLLPPLVIPAGLSLERKWYLYNSIRPYCSPGTQDLVCPLPSGPVPPTCSTLVEVQGEDTTDGEELPMPPAKRQRVCGLCSKPGHNRATCTENTGKELLNKNMIMIFYLHTSSVDGGPLHPFLFFLFLFLLTSSFQSFYFPKGFNPFVFVYCIRKSADKK